jgi:hypothetical protein
MTLNFALHILDEALGTVAGENLQAVFVGHVSLGFALRRSHVLKVGSDRFCNGRTPATADFLYRVDASAIGFEFDSFPPPTIYHFGAIFDLVRFLPSLRHSMQ